MGRPAAKLLGATIGSMAKFKPAKAKRKGPAVPQGALPCVVAILGVFALLGLILFLVIKNS